MSTRYQRQLGQGRGGGRRLAKPNIYGPSGSGANDDSLDMNDAAARAERSRRLHAQRLANQRAAGGRRAGCKVWFRSVRQGERGEREAVGGEEGAP